MLGLGVEGSEANVNGSVPLAFALEGGGSESREPRLRRRRWIEELMVVLALGLGLLLAGFRRGAGGGVGEEG